MKSSSASSPKKSVFSKLFFIFILMFASTQLYAEIIINSVKEEGITYNSAGTGTLSVTVNVTVTGTGTANRWRGTSYAIDSGACTSVNSVNHDSAGTYTETIDVTIPAALGNGDHNITFIAASADTACSASGKSLPFKITIKNGLTFDCDTLYGASDYSHVYKFNNPAVSTVQTDLYRLSDDQAETIALGPFAAENGTLTMFNWYWGDDTDSSTGEVLRYIHNNSTPTNGKFTVPKPDGTSFRYYSGGEINQISGQLYLTNGELAQLQSNFRMTLATPVTSGTVSNYTLSGKIEAKTPSDTILGSNLNYNGYVASDMAIDADGNAYIIVSMKESSAGADRGMWLMKVEPGANGNWKYSRVKQIITATGSYTTGVLNVEDNIYGSAFLNGKLYAAVGYDVSRRHLYEIDPLTGVAKSIGKLNTGIGGSAKDRTVFDLASCQVATAITGKVYYDEDGDGVITGTEKGIPNVVVAIYDKNGKYLGEQNTSASGEYSLLSNDVGSAGSVLYVRLKQPYVNGTNAHQTWASGGSFSWSGTHGKRGTNTAEPICHDALTTKQLEDNKTGFPYPNQSYYYYGRACDGANANGTDPSYTDFSTSGGRLNGANYYTKVTMPTDRANVKADFALGPIDRGDAPASYGDASHSMVGSNSTIGEKIDADDVSRASADAQGDDKSGTTPDDEEGVWITIPSEDGLTTRTLRLDDALLSNSNNITLFTRVPYKFTVKVNEEGYLSAWTHINKTSGNTNRFTERMHNVSEIQDGGAGDEDGVKNGEIVFTYTIPKTITLSGKQNIFFRFRYASTPNATKGFNAARGDSWWNTAPWVTTGEVEDYGALYDASATPFYCSILYATTLNGTIYGFTNPAISTSFIEDDYLFWFNSTKYGNMGSIAIGKYIDKIAMFSWSYDSNKSIKVVKSGESDIGVLASPRPLDGISNINDARRYWSGGVRHPQNGIMYLSGYANLTIHTSPYANILTYNNDVSGGQLSGNLTAALAGMEINGRLASDAFLGADGHIYTLGVEGTSYYLLHINPNNWQYAKGAAVSGISTDKWIYGLAFLNGKIYAATTSSELYEIDPTTGAAKRINGSITNNSYYDLATCQVAPILSGTLYFDENADGALSSTEKDGARLSNVTVELYDKNKAYLSTAITNANGEYSFMLNSLGDTEPFYIRVKQPHIGGDKAVQTWASGSDTAVSSVYGVCDNTNHTADGECYGANGPFGIDGGASDLADANYYSILIVKDSSIPAVVDFGFSGVDRGDAPSRYGEARHSAIRKIIRLGENINADLESKAGENADKDNYDDGVQIKKAEGGSYTALQGATLEANTTYIFRVALNGNMSSDGHLKVWTSLHNIRGNLNRFIPTIFAQGNITDSFVEFNYTVPMSMFGDEYVYFRFRFALGNATCPSDNATLGSCSSNLTFGEVEDYRVRVKNNNPRDLEEIFNKDLYGDVRIIGNTIMARANTTGFTPVCPPANTENNDANNKNNTVCWNVDNLTSSSSSAYLDIPSGATIEAAFLRWQGGNIKNVYQYNNATKVTLIANGSPQTVTAEVMNWYDHAYQGTANITDIVTGAGNYSVGNIFTSFDKNSYGAWAIIVVYNNENDNSEVLRKAVIYDGFAPVMGNTSQSISVSGFKTSNIGSVDSKMYLFAGEGDYGGGDSIKLNDKTVGGSDPFSGRITYFGENVEDRNASCVNNLAADIHTYNVGTSGANAIGNDITEADAEFTSGSDTYYLGLVGLSIQLYEPRVCYYINTIVGQDGTTLFENGTFGTNVFSENQNYTFNMLIANMQDKDNSSERDIAYNVQAHMSYMKPEQLNYTVRTTYMKNVGEADYSYTTDDFYDDLGEYENTSYKHTWRVGDGADSSKGGKLEVSYSLNTPEKTLIELGMYLGQLDANASENGIDLEKYLRFQASYNSGVSNTTRVKDIAQCRPMDLVATSDPVIGSFNVVNENLPDDTKKISADADDEANALYTQISGKPFNVKLIALKKPDAADPTKLDLVDYHTNKTIYTLHLIEGESYDKCANGKNADEIAECCEKAPEVGYSTVAGYFNQDNDTTGIQKINLTSNVTVKYGKFQVRWKKTFEDSNASWWRYSCSADRFAIRPDSFGVSNITGTKLIGGAMNNATLNAYNYDSTLAAYNEASSALSYNATLVFPSSCNETQIDTNINSTNFWLNHGYFTNGQSNMTIKYNNVGNMSAVVIDSNYTHVDRKYYTKSGTKQDCIADSATNGEDSKHRIGCDIASDNVSMRFVPKDFRAIVKVTNANGGNFTYLSNNTNMTAEVTTNLTARIEGGIAATNYHQNCFAKNVTYTFDIQNTGFDDWYITGRTGNPQEKAVFFEENDPPLKASIESGNNNVGKDGTGIFDIKEGNFTNGIINDIKFGFNFGRQVNAAENPFTISNITEAVNVADNAINDGDTYLTNATVTGDNITFLYGRVFIDDQEDVSPITAPVEYELYCYPLSLCDPSMYGTSISEVDTKDSKWFSNNWHSGTSYGNTTNYTPRGSSNITSSISPDSGTGSVTIENNANYTPYQDTIHAVPSDWLIYNIYNPSANHIEFTVKFIGNSGGWAGRGSTNVTAPLGNVTAPLGKEGVVLDVDPGNKTKSRMSW